MKKFIKPVFTLALSVTMLSAAIAGCSSEDKQTEVEIPENKIHDNRRRHNWWTPYFENRLIIDLTLN